MRECDLTRVQLADAAWTRCDLASAVWIDAELDGADLRGSELAGMDPRHLATTGALIDRPQSIAVDEGHG